MQATCSPKGVRLSVLSKTPAKEKSHLNTAIKHVSHHAQHTTTVSCLTNILEIMYSIFDSIQLWTVQNLGQEIHSLETNTHTNVERPLLKKTEVCKKAENV